MDTKKYNGDDKKVEFLYNSIQDIQNTIRSIDTKIFGLLIILVLPFSFLEKLYDVFENLWSNHECLSLILGVSFLLSWLISLSCSIRAVYSVDNPDEHIVGKGRGFFYSSNLFDLGVLDAIKISKVSSNKSLEQYSEEIKSDWDVIDELIFEQMKLVCIRSFKFKFQKVAVSFLGLSILIGLVSWFLSKVTF